MLQIVTKITTSLENNEELVIQLRELSNLKLLSQPFRCAVEAMIPVIIAQEKPNCPKKILDLTWEIYGLMCKEKKQQLEFSIVKHYNMLNEKFSHENAVDLLFDIFELVEQQHQLIYGANFWKSVMQLSDVVKGFFDGDKIKESKISKLSCIMIQLARNIGPSDDILFEELFFSLTSMLLSRNIHLKVVSSIAFNLVALHMLESSQTFENSVQPNEENLGCLSTEITRQEFAMFIENLPIKGTMVSNGLNQTDKKEEKDVIEKPEEKNKSSPYSSSNDLPNEKLISYSKQMDDNLKSAITHFEKVKSRQLFESLKQSTFSVRIGVSDLVSIINLCYQANEKITVIIHRVVINPELNAHLSNKLNDIFEILTEMWKTIHIVKSIWNTRKIKGKFRLTFQRLQDSMKRNLNTLMNYVREEDQKLMTKQLDVVGINLKPKNSVYDYEIEETSVKNRLKAKIEKMLKNTANYKDKNVSLSREMALASFETTSEIPLDFGIGGAFDDSDFISPLHNEISKKLPGKIERRIATEAAPTNDSEVKLKPESRAKSTSYSESKVIRDNRRDEIIGYRPLSKTEQSSLLKKQFAEEWIKELNEMDGVSENIAEYEDTEDLEPADENKLRYALLARLTRPFQSSCVRIMTEINRAIEVSARRVPDEKQTYKFIFLVDNSGSMDGDKMTLALNILIVLLESLKKMEYETAVVRFGGEESQTLLKHFSDEMDQERGQFILEAFDANEKTLPVDALRFIAESDGLYKSKKQPNEHRFIVLITDGIWQQTDEKMYKHYLSQAGKPDLLILTTHPAKDKSLSFYNTSVQHAKRLLDTLAKNQWWPIDPAEDFGKQIVDVATLIDNILRKIAKGFKATLHRNFTQFKILDVPAKPLSSYDKLADYDKTDIKWGKSVIVSDINKPNEFDEPDADLSENLQREYEKHMATPIVRLHETDDATKLAIAERAKAISKEEEKHSQLIHTIDGALDSFAFPNNRPTRLMQDYHGPSFSIKGFIKFLCTDGQYRKIYENMIGYPRKDYMVSIILDVSKSMAGMGEVGSSQSYITLAAALNANNIQFSLYTAGTCTQLIKDFHEEWNNTTKAKVYDALSFKDNESNLSDAVLYAVQHCTSSGRPKVEKTIFVLTDGYPSAPKKLQMALSYADNLGVHVIALGVGYFTEGIFSYYQNFVVVNNPVELPRALQNFYSGEPKHEGIREAVGNVVEKVIFDGKELKSMDQAWQLDMEQMYKKQTERIKKELRFATTSLRNACNTFRIDLCFVLDTTGSMRSYLAMAKSKIKQITENINKHVSENSGRSTDLRLGFVSYKARGNSGHLNCKAFTTDHNDLQDFVNKQRSSGGQGDEDKEDGILKALDFDWCGSVKFLVLIGDVPDGKTIGTMDKTIAKIAMKEIYVLYVSIKKYTDKERMRLKNIYQTTNSKIKDTGFKEIHMNDINGNTDKLSEAIVKQVTHVIMSEFM